MRFAKGPQIQHPPPQIDPLRGGNHLRWGTRLRRSNQLRWDNRLHRSNQLSGNNDFACLRRTQHRFQPFAVVLPSLSERRGQSGMTYKHRLVANESLRTKDVIRMHMCHHDITNRQGSRTPDRGAKARAIFKTAAWINHSNAITPHDEPDVGDPACVRCGGLGILPLANMNSRSNFAQRRFRSGCRETATTQCATEYRSTGKVRLFWARALDYSGRRDSSADRLSFDCAIRFPVHALSPPLTRRRS